MSIGVLGGSFDPVHNGHLAIAQYVYDLLGLDEVRFMPCGQHSFAKPLQASKQQRLEMLQLVLADKPHFSIDRRELERTGTSYTIDSLRELRQEIGNSEPLYFLIGTDALASLPQWQDWQKLLDYCHFLLLDRGEYITQLPKEVSTYTHQHQADNLAQLQRSAAGKLFFPHNPNYPISSTHIRQTPLSCLHDEIPTTLFEFIRKHQLYVS